MTCQLASIARSRLKSTVEFTFFFLLALIISFPCNSSQTEPPTYVRRVAAGVRGNSKHDRETNRFHPRLRSQKVFRADRRCAGSDRFPRESERKRRERTGRGEEWLRREASAISRSTGNARGNETRPSRVGFAYALPGCNSGASLLLSRSLYQKLFYGNVSRNIIYFSEETRSTLQELALYFIKYIFNVKAQNCTFTNSDATLCYRHFFRRNRLKRDYNIFDCLKYS